MSGGGGSGQATSQTHTGPPAWLQPFGKLLMSEMAGQVFPGMPNQAIPGLGIPAGGQPSLAPYPSGLNQQVAPFSGPQQQAMQMGQDVTGSAQGLANTAAGTVGNYASGGMLGPNPYLNNYYNQAAGQDVANYSMATAPELAARFQQAGAFNSPGYAQASGLAQYGLGQSLATLGANIYEPAYQFESGQALNAAQQAPSVVGGLYQPGQQLYNIGAAQQQQQQNVLNTNQANAAQQANYPFNLLGQFAGALGPSGMGSGTTTSTGPAMKGGK